MSSFCKCTQCCRRKFEILVNDPSSCACTTRPKIFKETGYRFIEYKNAGIQECTRDEECCCDSKCNTEIESYSIKTCLKKKKSDPTINQVCIKSNVCLFPVKCKSVCCSALKLLETLQKSQRDVNISVQLNMDRQKNNSKVSRSPPCIEVVACNYKKKKKVKNTKQCQCSKVIKIEACKPIIICDRPPKEVKTRGSKTKCKKNWCFLNKVKYFITGGKKRSKELKPPCWPICSVQPKHDYDHDEIKRESAPLELHLEEPQMIKICACKPVKKEITCPCLTHLKYFHFESEKHDQKPNLRKLVDLLMEKRSIKKGKEIKGFRHHDHHALHHDYHSSHHIHRAPHHEHHTAHHSHHDTHPSHHDTYHGHHDNHHGHHDNHHGHHDNHHGHHDTHPSHHDTHHGHHDTHHSHHDTRHHDSYTHRSQQHHHNNDSKTSDDSSRKQHHHHKHEKEETTHGHHNDNDSKTSDDSSKKQHHRHKHEKEEINHDHHHNGYSETFGDSSRSQHHHKDEKEETNHGHHHSGYSKTSGDSSRKQNHHHKHKKNKISQEPHHDSYRKHHHSKHTEREKSKATLSKYYTHHGNNHYSSVKNYYDQHNDRKSQSSRKSNKPIVKFHGSQDCEYEGSRDSSKSKSHDQRHQHGKKSEVPLTVIYSENNKSRYGSTMIRPYHVRYLWIEYIQPVSLRFCNEKKKSFELESTLKTLLLIYYFIVCKQNIFYMI
ncbi:hypothetical protein ABEB36_001420 [Hypothenemus hampei]|uniref:Uncharacterized protein n=1 Tax=Hypothenemus hampei TaxID=57062 RepID=A0ABD1FFE8_HYPHA